MNPWLEEHIECFIKKHLGEVPNIDQNEVYVRTFTRRKIDALKAVWWQAKRMSKGRQILLAGRDVFLFHMIGSMEGYFNIYRPDISSNTKDHESFKIYKDCYLLDTGHRGSVPMAIGIQNYGLIYCSGDPNHIKNHQVFSKMLMGYIKTPQGGTKYTGHTSPVYGLYSDLEVYLSIIPMLPWMLTRRRSSKR
jgi:hypothetical protein